MDQPFIQDEGQTVKQLVTEVVGKIGEKIEVKRFIRWSVGEAEVQPGAEEAAS